MHSTHEGVGRKEPEARGMMRLALTRIPSTASCQRANSNMTRRWKASRLIYRVDKLWGGYNSSRRLSERLSERLERTATSTRDGNARGRPSDIAQEALGSRSVSKAMECAWRGSSGRRGRVGRSPRHCAD